MIGIWCLLFYGPREKPKTSGDDPLVKKLCTRTYNPTRGSTHGIKSLETSLMSSLFTSKTSLIVSLLNSPQLSPHSLYLASTSSRYSLPLRMGILKLYINLPHTSHQCPKAGCSCFHSS